jgi:hypothetical protein
MSEKDGLVRQRAELLERIEQLELDSQSGGIEAVKREGAAIVAAREKEIEEQGPSSPAPVEQESERPKKKRGRRKRGGTISEDVANAVGNSESAGAVSAAQRSLDPADALPDYVLRRDDGSEVSVPADDPDVGPYARKRP